REDSDALIHAMGGASEDLDASRRAMMSSLSLACPSITTSRPDSPLSCLGRAGCPGSLNGY
ncbi:MAG: hypothetical protein ABIP62_08275, partial [Vicinamibacteria bacterium]